MYPYNEENAATTEKYKNYDFAVVKNPQDKTEYILYHTPTSTATEIGWASWRKIDIDFYLAVYKSLNADVINGTKLLDEYMRWAGAQKSTNDKKNNLSNYFDNIVTT